LREAHPVSHRMQPEGFTRRQSGQRVKLGTHSYPVLQYVACGALEFNDVSCFLGCLIWIQRFILSSVLSKRLYCVFSCIFSP
jgi:hypothetical protein